MSFYLKYRPTEFSEMLGNTGTISSLKNTLNKKDHPHVYLFVGPTGCGKTTAARICIKKLGVHPSVVHEVNSANNRGIETARQIIENLYYTPLEGSAVAYIIDEVHQTTKDWQNAMLKVLEDTPSHMYFFLCTTDDSKLIKALKGRCTPFRFYPLRKENALTLLKRVIQKENLTIPINIVDKIVEVSEGRPRELLVNLERVANVASEEALKLLDVGGGEAQIIDLCRALFKETPWPQIANILKKIHTQDAEGIRRAILGYAKTVLLNAGSNRAYIVIQAFRQPMYDIGMPGVIAACYAICTSPDRVIVPVSKRDF